MTKIRKKRRKIPLTIVTVHFVKRPELASVYRTNMSRDDHARIQEFSSGGGGGVQVSLTKKKALTTFFFFFFFFFFSPQLILQKSNGQFQRNLPFFKVPEGVQHFPGGGGSNFFQGGGSNCLLL